jgi:hypothetical protein
MTFIARWINVVRIDHERYYFIEAGPGARLGSPDICLKTNLIGPVVFQSRMVRASLVFAFTSPVTLLLWVPCALYVPLLSLIGFGKLATCKVGKFYVYSLCNRMMTVMMIQVLYPHERTLKFVSSSFFLLSVPFLFLDSIFKVLTNYIVNNPSCKPDSCSAVIELEVSSQP